jgi:hypothetical protein
MSLTVVIPFHRGDLHLAKSLLEWIRELGGCPSHYLLLVADSKLPHDSFGELLSIADCCFHFPKLIRVSVPNGHDGWPKGPNHVFKTVAKYVFDNLKTPWLFLEPDCVPLCYGWLDAMTDEYAAIPEKCMGAVMDNHGKADMPAFHLNGTAIYPQDFHQWLQSIGPLDIEKPFDLAIADKLTTACRDTVLIHNHWGEFGQPPLIVESANPFSPSHHFPITSIHHGAVLFHRDKQHSLIPLLRKRLFEVNKNAVPGSNEGKA